MKYVICDIDGTVACCDHRLHHLDTKNWDAFFGAMDRDAPIVPTIELLEHLHAFGYDIVFVSGRPNKYRETTLEWLDRNFIPYNELYMRPDGDFRADYIIKKEIFDVILDHREESPFLVIDDREQVISGCWLAREQFVLQVRRSNVKETSVDPEARLTVLIGPSGAGKSYFLRTRTELSRYPHVIGENDIISSDDIRTDMFGSIFHQSENAKVFNYLHEAVSLRLRNGMNAVVDATNLKRKDRLAVAMLAQGVCPVHYVVINRPLEDKLKDAGWRKEVPGLIERHENTFNSNLKDILNGDGLPNVVVFDLRKS